MQVSFSGCGKNLHTVQWTDVYHIPKSWEKYIILCINLLNKLICFIFPKLPHWHIMKKQEK